MEGKKKDLKYLIIGHPRCGSAYAAKLLTGLGIPTCHEKEPKDMMGLSSWAFLIEHSDSDSIVPKYGMNGDGWRKKYSFKNKIAHIRNPFDAFPSIINENSVGWSLNIRKQFIKKTLGKDIQGTPIEQAILCYLYWNEMAIKKADVWFRIEHDQEKVKNYLLDCGETIPESALIHKDKVNSKPKKKVAIDISKYKQVNKEIIKDLQAFCETYGYNFII